MIAVLAATIIAAPQILSPVAYGGEAVPLNAQQVSALHDVGRAVWPGFGKAGLERIECTMRGAKRGCLRCTATLENVDVRTYYRWALVCKEAASRVAGLMAMILGAERESLYRAKIWRSEKGEAMGRAEEVRYVTAPERQLCMDKHKCEGL